MKELIKSISKKEWRFVGAMSVGLIVLTGLPYFIAFLSTPPGFTYDGLYSLTPGDNPVYYSYINQIKNGEIFLKDLFTSESQVGLFNIAWFLAGSLAKIFNLSPIFTFHFFRLLLIPIFLFISYLFISLFFDKANWRKTSLIFLSFSAGIGAYFIAPLSLFDFSNKPGYWTPNDIWIPESITFLSLYKTPHYILSLILMMSIFLLMILAFAKIRLHYSIIAGFLALIYFNFHPFYIPMIFGSLGLYLLFLCFKAHKIIWSQVSYYLIFIIVSSPSIFYHFWSLINSPVLRQRAFQNVTLAPPFIFIFIGYGFLWLLGGFGLFWLIKNKRLNDYFTFLILWLSFSIILIVSPVQFQSRYTQGLHFPLVIFTVLGLYGFKEIAVDKLYFKKYNLLLSNKFLLAVVFFFAFGFSNFFNLFRDIYYFTVKPSEVVNYFYLPNELVEAMNWLSLKPASQTVLASINNSLFIPGFSGQSVFAAHGIETIYFRSKLPYVLWFFSSDSHSERKYQFLKDKGIDYVFISQSEKKPGYFNPDSKDYLKLVYQNLTVSIYQVIKK